MRALFRILLVTAVAALASCKVEIETPVEGGVTTTSGAIDCAADDVCTIDVVDIFFDETFVAEPEQGFVFAGWKAKPRGFCGGRTTPCQLVTAGFEGNESLISLLNDPSETFYLEPMFAVDRRTDAIDLDEERTLSGFGNTWELDFYRNAAYSCGLSGNYSFLVVEPASNPGAAAPLWVYLHGGGVGYFDGSGNYRSINNNANAWNHEETMDNLVNDQLLKSTLKQNGQLKDTTLTRRIQEGYRLLIVSMCDHDLYSGLGTPYPNNNDNPSAEVNGLQATMAAVEYTVANYATTHVIAHGTSAGSVGAFSLASAFAAEGTHLTAVVADSYIVTPRIEPIFQAYAGVAGYPFGETFDIQGVVDKIGFYIDMEKTAYPEARVSQGFDEVPILFIGGAIDQFCAGNLAAIPEAVAENLENCDYVFDGLRQAVAAQPDSPHQVSVLDGQGHTPTNNPSPAHDVVDAFIEGVLLTTPPYPFAE
ncbi:MAG: hypothetical protein U5K56_19325 [Halioglobus sp.]|nr:hypothetical protein [Halioglobus sp.]